MKCFEGLVLNHLQTSLPKDFDQHQFAYQQGRSTEDAVAIALHSAFSHLEHSGSYVRMLFVDYSSAFNTIIPNILINKMTPHTCAWIKDFLTNCPQTVKLGPHLSTTIMVSTGSPQGCVLSPTLYSLYTYDCTPAHPTNTIIKFADDTTVVGLISGGDESAYRDEVQRLVRWCSVNNLSLNTKKNKEFIIDFRKCCTDPLPLFINGDRVERVESFKFLSIHISVNLTWSVNTLAAVKKAQQRMHFLRLLKRNCLNVQLLVTFYRASIESILAYCITVCYAGCTAADKKALQRVINTAQKVIGCPLPSLEEVANTRYLSRGLAIIKDCSHSGHHLFDLLPSGWRYRSLKSQTNRLKHSFFPTAIRSLNEFTYSG
ncbi:hypothetical protein LDENG_00121410 [Lucifuga dentata]|nr:hypothetical protein LDENG_00121410 [Lucifuga dentata]